MLPPAIAVVLLTLPAAATGAPRHTEDTRRSLEETERLQAQQSQAGKAAAERAARAAAEAARLTQQRVTAAARLQQADTAVQTAAARIDALAAQRRQAEERLRARAAALQPLLPLIERLSLYPVETLLATPEDPEGALRGILVLKGLSHTIEVDAEALRHDQEAVDAATAALQAEQPRLA
jgi:murein hydrolase activator